MANSSSIEATMCAESGSFWLNLTASTNLRRVCAKQRHLRAADFVVPLVAIGLRQTLEVAQQLLSPIALAAHAEVVDYTSTRRTILPHACPVIAPSLVVCLDTNRRLVRFYRATGEYVALDRTCFRLVLNFRHIHSLSAFVRLNVARITIPRPLSTYRWRSASEPVKLQHSWVLR